MSPTTSLPPLDWHSFLTTWQVHQGWVAACVVLLGAYLVGLRAASRRGQVPVNGVRVACFVLGVVTLAVTMCSAVDAYAMGLFWMHMVEHLTLIMVVPALLVLGHPLAVLRSAGGPRWVARFDAVMWSRPLAILTHPFVGMTVYAVVIFYTHLTPFMDQMAHHGSLMTLEQVTYLVSGWLLLLPLIGEEPIRWRTPYLLRLMLLVVAMVPDTFVGIILLQTSRDPFPAYMGMRPDWATPPLHDLDIGGSLMWAAGDGLMMCLCVGIVVSLVSGRTRDRILGSWLESVRTTALVDHIERTGGQLETPDQGTVDDDDAVLDAYNRMLLRLRDPDER
ncbi:MAG: cytochrome c oxidase assembly protein [Nocardioides sp.]